VTDTVDSDRVRTRRDRHGHPDREDLRGPVHTASDSVRLLVDGTIAAQLAAPSAVPPGWRAFETNNAVTANLIQGALATTEKTI
jgi:hypothetical protein